MFFSTKIFLNDVMIICSYCFLMYGYNHKKKNIKKKLNLWPITVSLNMFNKSEYTEKEISLCFKS